MSKSKIIVDLANSTVSTETALKRAKVLFSELNDDRLLNWVNCEISGYSNSQALPDYRIVTGNLIGSYFKGSIAAHMTFSNVSLSLGNMPDDIKRKLLTVSFMEGVEALRKLVESSESSTGDLGKIIPADFFPMIAKYNSDPYMMITSARVIIGPHRIQSVFSAIENRLLDALILLEKEFGILDELDINTESKSPEELQSIIERLTVIIYNDNSVSLGNGNRINKSNIASSNTSS